MSRLLLPLLLGPAVHASIAQDHNLLFYHDFRAGQISQQSKQKVDILGQVLKKHVSQLRSGEGHFAFRMNDRTN